MLKKNYTQPSDDYLKFKNDYNDLPIKFVKQDIGLFYKQISPTILIFYSVTKLFDYYISNF